MPNVIAKKRLTSFQIIILGFLSVIFVGTLLLSLPISSKSGMWTSFENSLFTATSAVCVTGLVVVDTSTYWSIFGQAVILVLIQIGGLGIMTIMTFIATVSGMKISLLQRGAMQDSISAHQIGGIVKMTSFVFRITIIVEVVGALIMMPSFIIGYGAKGIWMSFFHSISAFCNAGFDIMGEHAGEFSSLTSVATNLGIIIPICLLIVIGGIGFLTWDDILTYKFKFKRYRMQTKVILLTSCILIVVPALYMFFSDFADLPIKERICYSIFQSITPRTAGFNTVNFSTMTGLGRIIIIILMLIGGSPGSTAGGLKTTTLAVLVANTFSTIRRKKNANMFGRRIEDDTVKNASTLVSIYLTLTFLGTFIICLVEKLPIEECMFEVVSALGTVGLSLGITPGLSIVSHLLLCMFMFFGRVGGLTIIFAALGNKTSEVSQNPIEKINVG